MISIVPIINDYMELPYSKILFWTRGGSSLENSEELGWAHLIEHLLFKLRIDNMGIADFVEGLGGYSNAFTSHDDVVLEISIMNEHVEKTLVFLEKLISLPLSSVSEKDFEEERSVVIEEMYMYEDEPTENLFQSLMENSFPGHVYGRKIIGEENTLKNATLEKLETFFRQKMLFSPFIIISGGWDKEYKFNTEIAEKEHSEILEKWETTKRIIIRHNQNKDYFMAGWRLPIEDGKLSAISKLIFTITYGMDGGRLYNQIVYETGTFDNLSLSLIGGRYGTCFLQTGAFSPSKEANRIKKWIEIWDAISFTQIEVAKAKEVILSTKYFSSEGIGESPYLIGKSYTTYDDKERFEHDYFYWLFHLSAKELNDFKEKYLRADQAVLGMAVPKKSSFSFESLEIFSKQNSSPAETYIRKKAHGVKSSALIRENSQFLTLYILKKSGVMNEVKGKEGGFRLFIDALCASAKGMTRDETEAYLDRFGISLSSVSGNNTGGFKLKVRDSFVPEAIEILKKTLDNPIKEEDFNQEKQFAMSNFSLKKEDPGFLFKEKIHSIIFKGTPYENLISGTEKTLTAVSFEDISSMRERFFGEGHWGVGISGAIDKKEREDVFKYLADINSKSRKFPVLKKKELLGERIEKIKAPGKKQLYITKLFHAPSIYSQDFESMRFLEQFLVGQKSPYFQKLREENGLVYSLDIWGMGGIYGGYLALSAITSPEKKDAVMDGMNQVISLLKKGDFDGGYLEEIKNSARFQHAQSVVKNDFHSFNLALEESLDFPFCNYLKFPEIIDKITKNTMVDLSEKYFSDSLWIISKN